MPWTLAKGHKGPVKSLRALGPQGPNPLFTLYSLLYQDGQLNILCALAGQI
jgi:hypothetical protein